MNSFICNFKKQYKKVVFELLLFVVLLFLSDRLLFMLIKTMESAYYKQNTTYSLKDKFAMISKKSAYKILILGSSHAYDGIHPFYFWSQLGIRAFKEAFIGKGPMYNYYFYQEYKKQMGIPKMVIYGVDYFMYNITSSRSWMQRFTVDVVDALYYRRGISVLLANKNKIDNFFNNILNNLKINLNRVEHSRIEQDHVLMEDYLGLANSGDVVTQEPPEYDTFFFFTYPGQEGAYFSRLMEELHRDQVTVLLVSLPEFEGTYRSNKSHRRFLRAFKLYQRKFANIHFLNYNRFKKFDLKNAEYFIDGGYGKTNSHLSRSGARILNQMLTEDLRRFLPQNEIQKR